MLKVALDSLITFFRKTGHKTYGVLTFLSTLPFLLELVNEKYQMYKDTIELSYPFLDSFLPIPDWLIVMSFIIAVFCWLAICLIFGMDKLKNF